MARRYKYSPPKKTKVPVNVKKNKPRINKTMVGVFVFLISAGLLTSTVLWSLPSGSFSGNNNTTSNNQAAQKNNNDQIIKSLVQEVYKKPNDFNVRTTLADQYYQAQKFKLAIEQYEKAIALGSKDVNSYGDLATSYFYIGQSDKAIEIANKALKMEPNHPTINVNLARYLAYGKNNTPAAIAQLQKYLKQAPNDQDAKKLLTELKTAKPQSTNTQTQTSNGPVTTPGTNSTTTTNK